MNCVAPSYPIFALNEIAIIMIISTFENDIPSIKYCGNFQKNTTQLRNLHTVFMRFLVRKYSNNLEKYTSYYELKFRLPTE